jgi:hypothetical protein
MYLVPVFPNDELLLRRFPNRLEKLLSGVEVAEYPFSDSALVRFPRETAQEAR